MLKASLDWINAIAFPNARYDYPNDENKVKSVAHALGKCALLLINKSNSLL